MPFSRAPRPQDGPGGLLSPATALVHYVFPGASQDFPRSLQEESSLTWCVWGAPVECVYAAEFVQVCTPGCIA